MNCVNLTLINPLGRSLMDAVEGKVILGKQEFRAGRSCKVPRSVEE